MFGLNKIFLVSVDTKKLIVENVKNLCLKKAI